MDKILALGVAAAIALGGLALTKAGVSGPMGPQGPRGEQGIPGKDGRNGVDGKNGTTVLGATGDQHYNVQTFFGDIRISGSRVSSSTSASVTLAGTEFNNASYLDYTVNVGDVTLTLPASTTALCAALPSNMRRTVFIRHATTTASSDLTLAGGTGFAIKRSATTTTAFLHGDTDGNSYFEVQIARNAHNRDCTAFVIPFND